jgi:prophage regulatory protein
MFKDKAQMITDRYLRRGEVERITGFSRSTIYRRIDEGSFPRPYGVGGSAVRWRESELFAWMSHHKST